MEKKRVNDYVLPIEQWEWPFKEGQPVKTRYGGIYTVVGCDFDDIIGEWWVKVSSPEFIQDVEMRAKNFSPVRFTKSQMRTLIKCVK